MAGEAKHVVAEVEILRLRFDALEEILKPFAQDSTSPKPCVNIEYVEEEMAVLSQRSEELHDLCHDKEARRTNWSREILERTIALKTLFIGIKQAPNYKDKIATPTARFQELLAKVDVLEKSDQARESGMKQVFVRQIIAENRATAQRKDRDEMQKNIEEVDEKIEKFKQALGQIGGMFT